MEPRESLMTSVAAQVVAVLAFYLYFAGWSYAFYLRTRFGLSADTIDTPAYFYFVFAYSVFFSTLAGWALAMAIALSWWVAARLRFVLWAEMVGIVLLTTIPFVLIDRLARSRAEDQYAVLRSGNAPAVHVLIKDEKNQPAFSEILQASMQGKLFLLAQTKDRAYLFTKEPDRSNAGELPEAQVFTVNLDDITLSSTLESVKEHK